MRTSDPTQRFSSRVENYIRYRPGYPPEILDLLKNECGLTRDSFVADIASGTGIFSHMLLENGSRVFGVEPNPAMRKAGEEFLADYPRFTSICGTAEATTLPDHSVDFVTAAQAAHWFDRGKAHREFVRILKPGGWLVLIWNERRTSATPFLREYEQLLLTYGTDYQEVRHEHTTATMGSFFGSCPFQQQKFEMRQEFDYAAAEGRLLSSSYVPQEGHSNYQPMLRELRRIFDAHQFNDRITFEYNTLAFYGRLAS